MPAGAAPITPAGIALTFLDAGTGERVRDLILDMESE